MYTITSIFKVVWNKVAITQGNATHPATSRLHLKLKSRWKQCNEEHVAVKFQGLGASERIRKSSKYFTWLRKDDPFICCSSRGTLWDTSSFCSWMLCATISLCVTISSLTNTSFTRRFWLLKFSDKSKLRFAKLLKLWSRFSWYFDWSGPVISNLRFFNIQGATRSPVSPSKPCKLFFVLIKCPSIVCRSLEDLRIGSCESFSSVRDERLAGTIFLQRLEILCCLTWLVEDEKSKEQLGSPTVI